MTTQDLFLNENMGISTLKNNIQTKKQNNNKLSFFEKIGNFSKMVKGKISKIINGIDIKDYIDDRLVNKKSLAITTVVATTMLSPENANNTPHIEEVNKNVLTNICPNNANSSVKSINPIFDSTQNLGIIKEKNNLPQFKKKNFVSYEGKFYFVVKSDLGEILLKDICSSPGEGDIILYAKDKPLLEKANIEDIIKSFYSYNAEDGENATTIAEKLGLPLWGKGLIFSLKKVYNSDRNINAGVPLYALSDPEIVESLFREYQKLLKGFKVGDNVICKPKGKEEKKCKILEVGDSELHLTTKHKGETLNFQLNPTNWHSVKLTKATESNNELLFKEDISGTQTTERIETTKISDTKAKKSNVDDLKGLVSENDLEAKRINLENKEDLVLDTFKNNPDMANMFLGFFKGKVSKEEIAERIIPIHERVSGIMQRINIDPRLVQIAKKVSPGTNLDNILFPIIATESGGRIIFYPNNGTDWGSFQTQEGFAQENLKRYSEFVKDPKITKIDLKFHELKKAYSIYTHRIKEIKQNFKSHNISEIEKDNQILIAKRDYEKKIISINSPVIFDQTLMANIILSNYVYLMEKINEIDKHKCLKEYEKNFFYLASYLFGDGRFLNYEKSGVIERYIKYKSQNNHITPWQFMKNIGFKGSGVKNAGKKQAYYELCKELEIAEAKAQLEKYENIYEKAKVELTHKAPQAKIREIHIPKTQMSEKVIIKHAEDLKIIKSLISTSQISQSSKENLLKAFILKLIIDPKANCEKVIDDFIKEWKKANYLGEYDSLLNSLQKLKTKYKEQLVNSKEGIKEVTQPEIEKKYNVFDKVRNTFKDSITNILPNSNKMPDLAYA